MTTTSSEFPYDLSTTKGKYWMVTQLINKFSQHVIRQDIGAFHIDAAIDENRPKLQITFNENKLKPEFKDLLDNPPPHQIEQYVGRFAELNDEERFIYVLDCFWQYCDGSLSVGYKPLEDFKSASEFSIPMSSYGAMFLLNRSAWGLDNFDIFADDDAVKGSIV
jgi:hypothetical protein